VTLQREEIVREIEKGIKTFRDIPLERNRVRMVDILKYTCKLCIKEATEKYDENCIPEVCEGTNWMDRRIPNSPLYDAKKNARGLKESFSVS